MTKQTIEIMSITLVAEDSHKSTHHNDEADQDRDNIITGIIKHNDTITTTNTINNNNPTTIIILMTNLASKSAASPSHSHNGTYRTSSLPTTT